jgi:CubicO group peptidase (beta-lactamase class C family)
MGVTELDGTQAVSDRTVFDVASLSKPVVAYAVLQLADAGAFQLDDPLSKFVSSIVPHDQASASITARHVLTHTSGLPNLRGKDPLEIHFRPGAWFSYSSVGFSYLQSAVEAVTSAPLEATMRRLVFEPLAMRTSSFEWHERFNSAFAHPHEGTVQLDKHRPRVAEASYSLQTTAADYASFVAAVLSGKALKAETHRHWLTPAAMVPKRDAVHLSNKAPETEQDIACGLGWGLEPSRGTFLQWGKMPGLRAFVMGSLFEQSAAGTGPGAGIGAWRLLGGSSMLVPVVALDHSTAPIQGLAAVIERDSTSPA